MRRPQLLLGGAVNPQAYATRGTKVGEPDAGFIEVKLQEGEVGQFYTLDVGNERYVDVPCELSPDGQAKRLYYSKGRKLF